MLPDIVYQHLPEYKCIRSQHGGISAMGAHAGETDATENSDGGLNLYVGEVFLYRLSLSIDVLVEVLKEIYDWRFSNGFEIVMKYHRE